MRRTLVGLALLSMLVAVVPSASASEATDAVAMLDVVGGGTAATAAPAVDCAGYAPEMALCTGSFTVEGAFGIRYGYQAGYMGYLSIKGETATYTVEIFCDVFLEGNAPSECDVTRTGEMYVGQRFVLTAVAPAFGYWLVQAPV